MIINLLGPGLDQKNVTSIKKYNTVDFIADYSGPSSKCTSIHDTKGYPLILAGKNQYFEIIKVFQKNSDSSENFILKLQNYSIIAIYNSKGKELISAKEDQKFNLLDTTECDNMMHSLLISISKKDDFSILYDVLNHKLLQKSSFINTVFYTDKEYLQNGYYLEVMNDNYENIKAIYCLYDNSLLLKSSDTEYLNFLDWNLNVIKKIDTNGECHVVYIKFINNFKLLCCKNELNLEIQKKHDDTNILQILGRHQKLCKYILFYNIMENTITSSNDLLLKEGQYLEISKQNLVNVMYKGKCIKVLNKYFMEIISTNYIDNCIPISYFKVTEDFIMEYNNNNCIAVYSVIGSCKLSTLIKTKDIDENILVRFDKKYAFLIYKNKKCVYIESGQNYLKRKENISYEFLNEQGITAGYIVKNGKKIGIFNNDLKIINIFEALNTSVKIIKYKIVDGYEEDNHGFRYPKEHLKLLYFKCDLNNNCRKIYNEKNELLLSTKGYFQVFKNNFILSYYNDNIYKVYSISKCKIGKMISTKSYSQVIIPYISKNKSVLFEIYDTHTKKCLSLYKYVNNSFKSLIKNYDIFYDFDEFLLAKNANKNIFIVRDLSKNGTNEQFCYDDMTCKLNISDFDCPYLYVKYKDKNYIYLIDKEGFRNTISCSENIEPIYIYDFLFFKVGEEVYNKVGNSVDN